MTTVQAVLFKLRNGNPPSTKHMHKIMSMHDWKPIKEGHMTDKYVRFRLITPDDTKHKYRIKHLPGPYDLIIQI